MDDVKCYCAALEKRRAPVLKIEAYPRCQEINDPASRFCPRCGLPLGDKGVAAMGKLEEFVVDPLRAVAEADPAVKEKFKMIVKEKGAEELFA